MAISNLLPRKAAGSKSRRQTLHDRLDYDQKEEKTRGGLLVSSYMCSPETAAEEFEASKAIYEAATGRSLPADRDIIAYRILQSFKPGEITPEEANRLGYELAMKFTKGKHQFVVSTHVDKAHIHTHIEFNSTNLECDGKFRNFKNSALALRRLNDQICREHGYSVIGEPEQNELGSSIATENKALAKPKTAIAYQEKAAAKRGRSYKERLRNHIDSLLPGCRDFDEFLARMRAEGYEVKWRGKSLEFRAEGQERFTRSYRLGEEYTEEALRGRINGIFVKTAGVHDVAGTNDEISGGKYGGHKIEENGRHTGENQTAGEKAEQQKIKGNLKTTQSSEKAGTKNSGDRREINLLVDIQAKLQAGKGKGYERWAKVFNLKEAAKTVNFLTENGITDYGELESRAEEAGKQFDSLSARIKQLEGGMAEKARLKMHIINYAKTREAYAAYKKHRYNEEFRRQHKEELEKHEAAKAAFDALDGKEIPKVAELSKEYAMLLEEKKKCYEEYRAAREEMIAFGTAKQNVDKILGLALSAAEKGKEHSRR